MKKRNVVFNLWLILILITSATSVWPSPKGEESGNNSPRRNVSLSIDENKILLRTKTIDITKETKLKAKSLSIKDAEAYYIVHFTKQPTTSLATGNFISPIGYNSYIMKMTPEQLIKTEKSEYVEWIGEYKPEYKIDPNIYEEAVDHRVTLREEDGAKSIKIKTDQYIVHIFEGEDISNIEAKIILKGAEVLQHISDRIIIRTALSNLSNIASITGVRWIEQKYRMHVLNDNDTWIVQTYQPGNRKVFDQGITGSGQLIALSDSGIDADHFMFWDSANGLPDHTYDAAQRKVPVYYNWYQTGTLQVDPGPPEYVPGEGYFPGPGDPMYDVYDWDINHGHGSHTSGTAAGEWPTGTALPTLGIVPTAGYDLCEGNAFGAKIVFQDLGRTDSPYIYAPLDLNDFNPAVGEYPGSVGLFPQAMADGAYIHSNSWGGGGYGEYSSYSQDIDEMMWSNQDFLVIFSNGNDGPGTTTITPPATAKNCLSVGATETSNDGYGHDSNNVAYFSSWGPTGGWGRTKPDVCAPGYYIFSAENNDVTDGISPNDGLVGFSGTSMSAPTVAGCAALVREYYMTGGYNPVATSSGFMPVGAFTPSAALMKATIINSAEPMTGSNTGGSIPGYGQGWGRVLMDNALYFSGDARSLLVDDGVELDGAAIVRPFFKAYTVNVGPGQPLDVTLVYTDPPGTAGSAFQMVNYLYVEVDHPNGVDYLLSGSGNFYNGESIPNTSFIYPDVVQKVRINDPDPGTYTIFAVAFQTDQVTPGWNVQPFALAVSGNLVQSQGYVQFDEDYYPVTGPLTITLMDADLGGTGTAHVNLASSATGDSEANVPLTEVGSSGIFQGTFPCDPVAGTSPNDDILNVVDPDTLTVTYNDANPVGVRTDTASIDGVPPVISNVDASSCNGQSVKITWNTDESSDSTVQWGTTPAYGDSATDSTMTTNHVIEFDGLEMGTTYYYEVSSTDENGNTASSGPHTFTTPMIYTPPLYHAGFVAELDLGVVLDDDDMWTGHNTLYAGIRHGVFQFDLTGLPPEAYLTSVQIKIFKQDDDIDVAQSDTWSCNLIDFSGDLYLNADFDNVHNAPVLVTMSPTWTSTQLSSDLPGTEYVLGLSNNKDIRFFNPGRIRADYLTFRLDGATTGDSIMSWDTGYRQDLGSIGVCYKPQLIITYSLPVGGVVTPSVTLSGKLTALTPYLAFTMLVVALSTLYTLKRKHNI